MGTSGPPELESYRIRRAFWEKLGQTPADLASRPWRDIENDLLIMSLEAREEQIRSARRQRTR